MTAVALRQDYKESALRALAKAWKSSGMGRRLLALAMIYDGGSHGDAARVGAVRLQTIRDWVLRFNARGPDGLVNDKALGPRSRLADEDRRASTYIFGAICSAEGKGAGLVVPRCATEAMALHLTKISAMLAPGAHAILVLDKAGWHVSKALLVPANITLVPLPAKSPELNTVENVWQFMRDNWLSNRIFTSYEDIVDHCCFV